VKTEQITILARLDCYRRELSPRSIEGYTDPTFPGLAVHRGIEYAHDLWYVTHLDSGYAIHCLAFEKRKQAIMYAQIAASVADWTQNVKDLFEQYTGRKLMDAKAYTKAIAV